MIRMNLLAHTRRFDDEQMLAFSEHAVATYASGMAYAAGLAWQYAALGRDADARALVDRIAADDFAGLTWDANWLSCLGELAEATALLGDRERAAALYERLLPYADRRIVAGPLRARPVRDHARPPRRGRRALRGGRRVRPRPRRRAGAGPQPRALRGGPQRERAPVGRPLLK
jgi:hypothetical protein